MVVFYHYAANAHLGPVVIWGFTGLHLFFVISGFLLTQSYLDAILSGGRFPSTRAFYRRRLLRIYPPYAISLVVYIALRYATRTNPPSIANIAAHLGLIFNYFPAIDLLSISTVVWTLAIEMQFYALLPLLARCFWRPTAAGGARRAYLFVLGLCALGLLSRFIEIQRSAAHGGVLFRTVLSFLDMFGAGALIALLSKRWRQRPGRAVSYTSLAVAAVLLIAANAWCTKAAPGRWNEAAQGDTAQLAQASTEVAAGATVYALLFPALICTGWAALLLANLATAGAWQNLFTAGPLFRAGQISYSIYLYHVGVQFAYFHVVDRWIDLKTRLHDWGLGWGWLALANALLALAPTIAFSALMYWLVERPSIALAARRPAARDRFAAALPVTNPEAP
jgi:peptidoglycan/LPS O-acetylase OafA/YrhL